MKKTNMLLKSIEIKNFRAIKDIVIDLTSKGSSSDTAELKLGMFKKTKNNKVVPAFISIFGRNSVGKTTILDAITFFSKAISKSQDVFVNNQILSKLRDDVTMCQWKLGDVKRNLMMDKTLMTPASKIDRYNQKIQLLNTELNIKKELLNTELNIKKEKFEKFNLFLGNPMNFSSKALEKTKLNKKDMVEFTNRIIDEKHYIQQHWFKNNKCYDGKNEAISITLNFEINSEDYNSSLNLDKNGLLLIEENDVMGSGMENYIKEITTSINDVTSINNDLKIMRGIVNKRRFIEKAILGLKQKLGSLQKLIKFMNLADEDITNIYINKITFFPRSNVRKAEHIRNIEIRGNKLDILQLSNGTVRFIYLANLILGTKGSLILIDEIDIYLHKELMDMLKILMKYQFEKYGTQTIFTTHSPLMVEDYTKFKQIYSLSKNNEDGITIEKLSKKFKNNNMSVIKRYLKGELANYPDIEKARNMMVEILYE